MWRSRLRIVHWAAAAAQCSCFIKRQFKKDMDLKYLHFDLDFLQQLVKYFVNILANIHQFKSYLLIVSVEIAPTRT